VVVSVGSGSIWRDAAPGNLECLVNCKVTSMLPAETAVPAGGMSPGRQPARPTHATRASGALVLAEPEVASAFGRVS
jgi:hypothetical protein